MEQWYSNWDKILCHIVINEKKKFVLLKEKDLDCTFSCSVHVT